MTKDQVLLALVEGYQIPLLIEPVQKAPKVPKLNQEQQKTNRSGREGNAGKALHFKSLSLKRGILLSSLFLISKKGEGNRPVINLKDLNRFIPYKHFKMQGLHCPKYVLEKGDYMCKIDLKDAYFSVPLHKYSRKLVRFFWGRVLVQVMIRVIIYLDDLWILGNSMSEIFMVRDSVIFLLQHLDFVINLKKCVSGLAQEIEFLGLTVNSQTMISSLPAEKIGKIKNQYLRLHNA